MYNDPSEIETPAFVMNSFSEEQEASIFHEFDGFNDADLADSSNELVEDFLGIGKRDKRKKAEKKLRKAEKQLAKGHTKAAARKTKKAEKLISGISAAQQKLASAGERLQEINRNIPVTDTTSTTITESPTTAAGQIGAEVGMTTPQAAPSGGGGGGGMDAGYYPETTDTNLQSDEPTGKLAEEKTLGNVTVSSSYGKKNLVPLIIGAVIVFSLMYFFLFRKK